jgi:GNAT superfamily N-acetyltransferase
MSGRLAGARGDSRGAGDVAEAPHGDGQGRTEALHDRHRLTTFDCGKPELDIWLRESARHAGAHRTCRAFVWHIGDGLVVAYFSLAAYLIERDILPKSLGHGAPAQIPAVLLARLALDKTLHGRGLGGVLLVDALSRAVAAGTQIGVRFVVVDAIDPGPGTGPTPGVAALTPAREMLPHPSASLDPAITQPGPAGTATGVIQLCQKPW